MGDSRPGADDYDGQHQTWRPDACAAGHGLKDPDDPTPTLTRRHMCGALVGGAMSLAAGTTLWGEGVPDELADKARAAKGFERDSSGAHVVAIGIDGLRPDALQIANTPNMDQLIGAGTISYRSFAGGIPVVNPQVSSSAPGWSSILTGVWVDKHECESNAFLTPNYRDYPHFYQRILEQDPKAQLASFVNWEPINDIIIKGMRSDLADKVFTGRPWGRAGTVDRYELRDAQVGQMAAEFIAGADPKVMFLHFDAVDNAGHSTAFAPDSPRYIQAIEAVDAALGPVIEAVAARNDRKKERWMFSMTTDHGGIGNGHGGQTIEERTIPFFVSGDGVDASVRLNGPGHCAMAPTVMTYLGLPIAEEWGWETDAFGLSS